MRHFDEEDWEKQGRELFAQEVLDLIEQLNKTKWARNMIVTMVTERCKKELNT